MQFISSMGSSQRPCRILSIQSHVVRGYVGNKAAVFPLQFLGHHVDHINSVQFTSMYIHEGERLSGQSLRLMLDTLPLAQRTPAPEDHPGPLKDESLIDLTLPVDHRFLLTGYVGSATFLQEICRFVKNQKKIRQNLPNGGTFEWVCDPVMGDNGKPYVPEQVISMYKENVVPLADVVTPNQYELEWLCDHPVKSLGDAIKCCDLLHQRGPKIVVVTSIALPHDSDRSNGLASPELILLASERVSNGDLRKFVIRFRQLDVYLGGTGDLMAAMVVDGLDRFDGRLDRACERAVAILQVLPPR